VQVEAQLRLSIITAALVISACHGSLYAAGRVVDQHGAAVSGAEISAAGPGLRPPQIAHSDHKGCFDYDGISAVSGAPYTIRVEHPGFNSASVSIRGNAASRLLFSLSPTASPLSSSASTIEPIDGPACDACPLLCL
jgi:hypothetical protein